MPRSKKSIEERIDAKDDELQKAMDKLNQIKEQKKALEKRKHEQERKARTHRLIVIGGIAEMVLGREFKDGDEKRFERFLKAQQSRGGFYAKAMNEVPTVSSQENMHTDERPVAFTKPSNSNGGSDAGRAVVDSHGSGSSADER